MLELIDPCFVDTDCVQDLETQWSVLAATGSIAALAGTIASVLFAVVGLILTIPPRPSIAESETPEQKAKVEADAKADAAARRSALRLLVPNLLAMFVASLLFSLVGGELTLERAAIMAVPAAGLLGISAVGTFVAITWSLKAYVQEHGDAAVRGGIWVTRVAWLVAGTQVVLTAVNAGHYLHKPLLPRGWHWGWDIALAVGFAVLALISSPRRAYTTDGRVPRIVRRMSRWCLGWVAATLIIYNIAALRSPEEWVNDPVPLFYLTIGATGLFVLVIGWGLLRSLPGGDLNRDDDP